MDRKYKIPRDGEKHLSVGTWVEIFEAFGDSEGEDAIQVQSMRISGKTLVFGKGKAKNGDKALRPHEGEIVLVDRGLSDTQFRIRLRP
jgi:hypothetical protein